MIVRGYDYEYDKMDRCVDRANELLRDSDFYEKISQKMSFDMATCSPEYIAKKMKQKLGVLKCHVKLYRGRRWSKALAYFTPSDPDAIYINTRRLGRSDGSVIATIIHEWVHLVDHDDLKESFGHGSNSPVGKQNTAPYWIDNLAQGMVDQVEDYNNNESSNIVYRISGWQRFKNAFKFWRWF